MDLWLGVRFASRQMRKAPGFTVMAVLALALGIGTTTAIFSLVEAVLLRPLPFGDAERLVAVGDHIGGRPNTSVTAREIDTYVRMASAFSSMGAYDRSVYELSGGTTPEQIVGARLTAGVFPTLGTAPMLGRVFTQQEEDAREPLTVISYALWVNRYGRDPQVLGKAIVLNRNPYTVIGVMPRQFEFPIENGRANQAQAWIPMSLAPDELSEANAGLFGFHLVARLKDGVTVEQAKQDADRIAQQVMRDFPPTMKSIKIRGDATPLRAYAVADTRPLLRMLFLAVSVVLLIACANVAGLLLVRAIRRRREYAVRLALGASARAILRESMIEGILLSVTGGLLGLAFAALTIRTALRLLPDTMPLVESVSLNATVAGFALVLALVTGILCSLAPAFAALKTNLIESLKEGARTGTSGASHSRLRSALVVAEIAIAMVLVTASAAFLRSFEKMRAVDPGFRADHVVVAGYGLPIHQYSTQTSVDIFRKTVLARLSGKPGTIAVGLTNALPASGFSAMSGYTMEGHATETWKLKFANFAIVSGQYFKTMSIPLLDGRYFTPEDRSNAPLVVILNETMAKQAWPGERAVGKRMHLGNPQKELPWATVVGVVADTKVGSRDEPDAEQCYIPAEQPASLMGNNPPDALTHGSGGFVALRSALPPEQMVQTLRATIADVDPLLALNSVEPMSEVISNTESPRRFNTTLVSAFAAIALLLAITGIYAVVAFSVSLRTQEIAIRMALGARPSGIAGLVLSGGAKLALLGCGLGVGAAVAVSRMINSLLFEVSATDPVIYAVGGVVMIAMALVASAIPARRAASTDPMSALRAV